MRLLAIAAVLLGALAIGAEGKAPTRFLFAVHLCIIFIIILS
jgi:hypothetical protein